MIQFIILIVNIIVLTLIRAYTIGTIWFWYIVPTFDLNPLSMIQAFGLSLFISYLVIQYPNRMEIDYETENPKSSNEEISSAMFRLIHGVSVATMFLIYGWVGTLWM